MNNFKQFKKPLRQRIAEFDLKIYFKTALVIWLLSIAFISFLWDNYDSKKELKSELECYKIIDKDNCNKLFK